MIYINLPLLKNLFSFSLLLLSLVLNNSCNKSETEETICGGKSRWDEKTLNDSKESQINFNPLRTTIAYLISTKPSKTITNSTLRFGIELNTYTFECRIKDYRLEEDGDYHIVLTDLIDKSKTMIGEIPNPNCSSVQKSKHNYQFLEARKFFENCLFKSKLDTGVYIISGVAFYDIVHGQLGVAPNGIEIHPILNFSKK